MPLSPGTRLGVYEVTGPLGAGGMGEVYRAHDVKLDRHVALKILPEAFAADLDRLARFEREAKTLAALNHPHIAQIYGVEESTGIRALVMELVEGDTLAERVSSPVPVDEALGFARQIADALHAAHEQGIIHRDLKPANIKVRADGTVKVLDFGLAKLTLDSSDLANGRNEGLGSLVGLTQSPTLALATQAGVILGTAAYMSPEQAKGRAADKRSDVWAFGCVLFEMLTGRRAFEGDDVSDTLASVLKTEPKWDALPADVSPPIRILIARCLLKDPRQRVADISVARFVLDEASSLGSAKVVGPAKAGHGVRRAAPIAVAVVMTAAAAGLAAWKFWPSAQSVPVARSMFPLPQDQQFSAAGRHIIAISRDGRQMVYVANTRLYVRALSEFGSHVIPGIDPKDGATSPVFSPDGASVAYYAGLQGLKQIPVAGGAPVVVCPLLQAPYGLTWHESGLIVGLGSLGIVRCAANGGRPEQLVKVSDSEVAHGPQLLPDGDTLLYTVAKVGDAADRWDRAQIVVESLSSHTRKTIIDGASDAKYLPTGHMIYAIGGDLFASRFDLTTQSIVGPRVAVLQGVRRTLNGTTGSAQMDVSSTGTLVYVPGRSGRASSDYAIAKANRAGAATLLRARTAPYVHVRASRDGGRLAFDTDDGRDANIWVYETDGKSDVNRLTFAGKNRFPIWSPDGQRIAFQSDREGDLAIWTQRVDGGAIERFTKPESGVAHIPESWSPDGAYIAYSVRKEGVRPSFELQILSLKEKKSVPFGDVRSAIEPIGAVFSPDGHWIAYHSRARAPDESSTSPGFAESATRDTGVFVQPFPAGGATYQAPKLLLDFQPIWSASGEELFYIPTAASGQIAAVRVIKTGNGIRFSNPENFPARVTASRTSGSTRAFDVLPDGQFIGPISSGDEATLATAVTTAEIGIVVNWFDELNVKVPAGR